MSGRGLPGVIAIAGLIVASLLIIATVRFQPRAAALQTPVFRLGMSLRDVVAMAGEPTGHWQSGDGTPWDIYWRKTATNEYKISVTYFLDRSASMLHPTPRLSYVRFELDHPQFITKVLPDLPEASAVCHAGCDVEIGESGFIVAPPGSLAHAPYFFTIDSPANLIAPVSQLDMSDEEQTPPLDVLRRIEIVWYPSD